MRQNLVHLLVYVRGCVFRSCRALHVKTPKAFTTCIVVEMTENGAKRIFGGRFGSCQNPIQNRKQIRCVRFAQPIKHSASKKPSHNRTLSSYCYK